MIERLRTASNRAVSRETFGKLERYVELVTREGANQNLIAPAAFDDIWERHVVDSAQLCRHVEQGVSWLDVGAGAGFPGIVVALITSDPVTMVEPRRLRADFLRHCVDELGLAKSQVLSTKVERVSGQFDVITARAVARLDNLFALTHRLSHEGTRWVLPKGRSGAIELAEARESWHGQFSTVPSITDGDSVIVLAERVEPMGGPRGRARR
ncbi:MAG TPA: 16S rRNA (guanine(527)-N(7))-methyltransferase RsmG [Sphingomicrobium sp.]|jgi:16S rRNA (guanine527-N7)-methyltransferase|nr:16S rRNA (guanine(527)-N(7))-methyltransferase RsmG [Sphingomicrobium sp.]